MIMMHTIATPLASRRILTLTLTLGLAMVAGGCAKTSPIQIAGADSGRGAKAISRYGCTGCHTVPGVAGPGSTVGPPLAMIAKRTYLGGVLANTPENMVRWLRDPPGVDPRTAMPNVGVTVADARDIAAYLYTLD